MLYKRRRFDKEEALLEEIMIPVPCLQYGRKAENVEGRGLLLSAQRMVIEVERERESVDSEPMVQDPKTNGARQSGHAAFIPKCITDKKYPLAVILVVTILLIVIITLAVRKPQPCSPCPPAADAACPDRWIGYHGKCYYKSENEGDWNASETICSKFGATLALIDSQWDLSFLVNLTRPDHHWIGLSRQTGQVWTWQNGTEFENQFLVRGDNRCAYLDDTGVSSTRCSQEKNFLCSQPDACSQKRKPNLAGKDT